MARLGEIALVSEPRGFGEFFLSGKLEGQVSTSGQSGWRARLEQYYYNELSPEEQKALFDGSPGTSYVSFVGRKFYSEIGEKVWPDYPPSCAIAAHEPPRSFTLERWAKAIGSLFTIGNQIWVVEEALKAIIERLEPGLHQFFPIEIRKRNGEDYPKEYYIIVIGWYFDSFSPENSNSWCFKLDSTKFHYKSSKEGISGLALRKSVFGNAHLWRERRIIGFLDCCSDELIAEINGAGLRIPKHYRMMEI